MEYYSVIKSNEVPNMLQYGCTLKNYTKWKKADIKWFHSYEMSRIDKYIDTESRLIVTRACKEGRSGVTANGYGIFQSDENILKWDSSGSYTTQGIY